MHGTAGCASWTHRDVVCIAACFVMLRSQHVVGSIFAQAGRVVRPADITLRCCCWLLCVCLCQVPLKVWQACSKLAEAGTPHKAAIAVSAAARLFRLLVGQDQAGAALSSQASSTLRGLQQQFQQSGLLLQLPNLLIACACKVQAATAAAAAAGVSVAADAAGTHASASSSGLGHDAPKRTLAGTPDALASRLLFTFANMCELQPNVTVNTPDGAACLLPVMHLTVTVRQYLSTAEGIKQGLPAHSNAHKLLLIVCEASLYCQLSMRWVAGKALSCPKSHAAALQHLKQQLRFDVRFQEWLCMKQQ